MPSSTIVDSVCSRCLRHALARRAEASCLLEHLGGELVAVEAEVGEPAGDGASSLARREHGRQPILAAFLDERDVARILLDQPGARLARR